MLVLLMGRIFNYAVEVGLGAMIYVRSFIMTGPGNQKLIGRGYKDTHTDSNVIL
jgi:hypothetical protein